MNDTIETVFTKHDVRRLRALKAKVGDITVEAEGREAFGFLGDLADRIEALPEGTEPVAWMWRCWEELDADWLSWQFSETKPDRTDCVDLCEMIPLYAALPPEDEE